MEVRFLCGCGEQLALMNTRTFSNGDVDFEVQVCPKCAEAAERDGFDAGQASMEGER